jgi:hypothetical protein
MLAHLKGFWFLWFVVLGCSACRQFDSEPNVEEGLVSCQATQVQFPVDREYFTRVYAGRSFYADGNHLGYDILLPEGTPISPIACGTVRVYRAAQGYGTLAVVIEHRFPEPRLVSDGIGRTVNVTGFLSIYGHLRSSAGRSGNGALELRAGDRVTPGDVIGYVQQDEMNGDGAEHLHLGIRLQTMEEAVRTDAAWFRGYDTSPSQRAWFADPSVFLSEVMPKSLTVRWHPPGSILAAISRPDVWWHVGKDGLLHLIDDRYVSEERLHGRVITVDDEEIGCYSVGAAYSPASMGHRLVKFEDASMVYEYVESPPTRFTFISKQAFDSWGWLDRDIEVRPAADRQHFLSLYADLGFRNMRDGSLVKARGVSEVSVVSDGRRLPFYNWQTFLAMGYKPESIVEIDLSVIDQVAFARGPILGPERIASCELAVVPEPVPGDAGMGQGVKDLSAVSDLSVSRAPELCNGQDDNGDGLVDEIFMCRLGARGGYCRTSCGAPGFLLCVGPACAWDSCETYPERCDSTVDEDCDGFTDCQDSDCRTDPYCQVPDMASTRPTGIRYEFRVDESSGWLAAEPYVLRDKWWGPATCLNTNSFFMENVSNGWYRCDLAAPLSPFVGSFYSLAHPTWGDRGNLGTVGNAPASCTPTPGVEWRITALTAGTVVYAGPSLGLSCLSVNGQSRHLLP